MVLITKRNNNTVADQRLHAQNITTSDYDSRLVAIELNDRKKAIKVHSTVNNHEIS